MVAKQAFLQQQAAKVNQQQLIESVGYCLDILQSGTMLAVDQQRPHRLGVIALMGENGLKVTLTYVSAILVEVINSLQVEHQPNEAELTVLTEKRDAVLTLDGQVTVKVQNSETIRVSRADFTSKFIIFPENSYYKVLKSKLHWGMTPYST